MDTGLKSADFPVPANGFRQTPLLSIIKNMEYFIYILLVFSSLYTSDPAQKRSRFCMETQRSHGGTSRFSAETNVFVEKQCFSVETRGLLRGWCFYTETVFPYRNTG
jgi:hypothetical protein